MKLTKPQLARELGVSPMAVHKWFSTGFPRVIHIFKMAKLLGCSGAEVLDLLNESHMRSRAGKKLPYGAFISKNMFK